MASFCESFREQIGRFADEFSGRCVPGMLLAAFFLLVGLACRAPESPHVPISPDQDHVINANGYVCIKPARISEEQYSDSRKIAAALSISDVSLGGERSLETSGTKLYYSGVEAQELNFILCMARANGIVSEEQASRIADGFFDAETKEVIEDGAYEEQGRREEIDDVMNEVAKGRRRRDDNVVVVEPPTGNVCDAGAVEVVQHVLTACDNARRECPENPLPPKISLDEYEALISTFPLLPVFFKIGEYELTSEQEEELKKMAGRQIPEGATVLVVGRASKVGRTRRNTVLARQRAQKVRDCLEDHQSRPRIDYEILSYGETTLYMRRDSVLGKAYQHKYQTVDELNQSVWVVVYACGKR